MFRLSEKTTCFKLGRTAARGEKEKGRRRDSEKMSSSVPLLETVTTALPLCSSPLKTRKSRVVTLASRAPPSPPIRNKVHGANFANLFLGRQTVYMVQNTSSTISCTMDMTEGESSGPRRLNFDQIMGEVNRVWGSLPQPVRRFPWPEALENFFELILGLICAVAKYFSVPLLAITSLSELSYCAHERKMRLVPIPLLAGMAMAGIFRDTTLDLYPKLEEGDFPWHLVAIASLFVFLKLPGPYYPYWGRIFIPHFANGGLLRTLWFSLMWYRRQPKAPETMSQQSPPTREEK